MTFVEQRIDDQIAEGAMGGPEFSTVVVTAGNSAEQRIGWWQRARLKWEISYGPAEPITMAAIIAFFRAMHGKLTGFRFKDWTDYQATGEMLVNYLTVYLQLTKTYAIGGVQEIRYICKPVTGTVQIFRNGTLLVAGTDYTIDYTTGTVTLAVAASAGQNFTWTGQFDVPVRFDVDNMRHINSSMGERNWESVPLIELSADEFINTGAIGTIGGALPSSPPAVIAGTVTATVSGSNAVVSGTSATAGTAPYSYQWYRSIDGGAGAAIGAPLTGFYPGTVPTGFVDPMTAGHTYGYYYIVTDAAAQTAQSNTSTVSLSGASPLVAGVASDTISGGTITLAIAVATGGTLSYLYRWYRSVDSGAFVGIGVGTVETSGSVAPGNLADTPAATHTYSYYNKVIDNTGQIAYSNTLSFSVGPGGITQI